MSAFRMSVGDIEKLIEQATLEGLDSDIHMRLTWFRDYAEHQSVSKVCRDYSIARTTFYRWLKRFDPEDLKTLGNDPRHPPAHLRASFRPPVANIPAMQEHNCMFCRIAEQLKHMLKPASLLLVISVLANILFLALVFFVGSANAASSWNPTLLVNTESFTTIDEGSSDSDIEMRFGGTLNEKIFYDRSASRFEATRGIFVNGDITSTGALSVQGVMSGAHLRIDSYADIWGNLAVSGTTVVDGAVTFGSTLTINSLTYTFPAAHGASGTVLGTDGSGNLTWTNISSSGDWSGTGALQSAFDSRYVNTSGDTMTGALLISDATGAEAALDVTGTVSGSTVHAQDMLSSSGSLSVDGLVRFRDPVDSTWQFRIFDADGGEPVFNVDTTNERIGIKTGDPDYALHIVDGQGYSASASGDRGWVVNDTDGKSAALTAGTAAGVFLFDETGDFIVASDSEANVLTGTNSGDNNIIRIEGGAPSNTIYATSSGDVGIGTDTPDTKLEVIGTASGRTLHAQDFLSSSGALSVDGTAAIDGAATLGSTLDTVGNITTDADLTINEDNGGANAVLTFGNDAGAETFTFSDSSNNFELSDDLDVTGTVNATGNITTDANLIINEDNGAADAVLTFGNDAAAETITFSDTTNSFEVSDDFDVSGTASGRIVHAQDNLTSSGGLSVDGATSLQSTLNVSGVSTFGDVALFADGVQSAPGIAFSGDTDTGIFRVATDEMGLVAGNIEFITLDESGDNNLIINNDGNDIDFRVEASGGAVSFFARGSDGNIGIGTTIPTTTLEVVGTASGRILHAQDNLTSSGGLSVDGVATLDDINSSRAVSTGSVLVSRTSAAPEWKAPSGSMVWYIDSDIAVGTNQGATITMPFGMTITGIDLKVKTAPVGSSLIIDINEDGSTIFSTNAEIDAGATVEDGNEAFSDTELAAGAEITLDVDQVGSSTAGANLTIMLKGTRHY